MRARVFLVTALFAWSALGAEPARPSLVPKDTPAPAVVPPREPVEKLEDDGITTKWWFWTAIGVVAVGAFAGAAIAVGKPQPRGTTLPDGDFR